MGKVEIPPPLRDFQAQWESPALGLFHGAAFSTALLPTNCAIEPEIERIVLLDVRVHSIRDVRIHLFRARKRTIAIADDVEVPEVKI